MAESKEEAAQPLLDPAGGDDGPKEEEGAMPSVSPNRFSLAGAEQFGNDMKSGMKDSYTQAARFLDMDWASVDPRSIGVSPTVPWLVVRFPWWLCRLAKTAHVS